MGGSEHEVAGGPIGTTCAWLTCKQTGKGEGGCVTSIPMASITYLDLIEPQMRGQCGDQHSFFQTQDNLYWILSIMAKPSCPNLLLVPSELCKTKPVFAVASWPLLYSIDCSGLIS